MTGYAGTAKAGVVKEKLPWEPGSLNAPVHGVDPNGPTYLTPVERRLLTAIADRIIPSDELSIGGAEAGCVTFIDRQLAGPYGRAASMYMRGRFVKGTTQQGIQSAMTPAERYRKGLHELALFCQRDTGKAFEALPPEKQDDILSRLENGRIAFPSIDSRIFFEQILQNMREGYLADPIYGGNRDMASWKMLGFPGARYDYRDYMDIKNQDLGLAPLSLRDRTI
ncbi:gluconate 2-dehydrogenase subunit 3 family protein [Asaia prunellae]|uniref:gluconate 2-dehydrogenase subunit 3 family protein n=1 Tax=Asaia prunellae TaxID=610245 RepID=UPI000AA431E5|nr:gluconate 2-dehydrogenase subunit 3 family protein [Asaia prunellae]